jgi:hypothetical protein
MQVAHADVFPAEGIVRHELQEPLVRDDCAVLVLES